MYEGYEYFLSFEDIVTDYFIEGLITVLIPAMILAFTSWAIVKAIIYFRSLAK